MALSPFNDCIQINAPKSLDNKYSKFSGGVGSPFTNTAQAIAAVISPYRHRGLTQLILDGGVATEYWYRDGIADGDLIPKGTSITTNDTASLFLSGIGTPGDPLSGDVQLSLFSNNSIQLFSDGLYSGNTIKQGVVYGGIVTWLQDYDYNISAAGYYINGVFYTSPALDVTLSAPDGTFNRIDTFIVDDTGVASVLEGTPSADPAQAALNPATQLELSIALVETGTTEPSLDTECIYLENTEWTTLSSSVRINANSSSSPCSGTKSIEATSTLTGDNIKLTRSSAFNPLTNYTILKLSIRSKGAFGGNGNNKRKLYFQFRNGVTNVGSIITILNGSYGFVDTNTTDCQNIAIPLTDFSLPSGASIDNLLITTGGNGIITGFWIDDICFQGIPVPPAAQIFTLTTTGTSGAATLIGNVLNIPQYSTVYTSNSGITKTVNNFQLGGILLQNTTLNANNLYQFSILNTQYVNFISNPSTLDGNRANFELADRDIQAYMQSPSGNSGSKIWLDYNADGNHRWSLNSWYDPGSDQTEIEGRATDGGSHDGWLRFNQTAGRIYIAGLTNLSTQDRLLGQYSVSSGGLGKQIGYITIGTGLSLSSGVLSSTVTGGFTTADNGLTTNTATNVQLGGTLLQNTTINTTGSYTLTATGSRTGSSSTVTIVNSSSGIALATTGVTGIGVDVNISGAGTGVNVVSAGTGGSFDGGAVGIQSFGNSIPVWLINDNSTTNSMEVGELMQRTGGVGAIGVGIGTKYDIKNSAGSVTHVGNFNIRLSTVTATSEVAAFDWKLRNGSSVANVMTLTGLGKLTLNSYGVGTFTGTPAYNLQVDASGNIIEGTGVVGGGFTTADNGLTANTSSNVQLGGTLLGVTTIDVSTFKLVVSKATTTTAFEVTNTTGQALNVTSTGGYAIVGTSTNSIAIWAISTNGTALAASSTNSMAAGLAINPSSTNSADEVLRLDRTSSGTTTAGVGSYIGSFIQNGSGIDKEGARYINKLTTVTNTSEVSSYEIQLLNAGTLATRLTLSGNGSLKLIPITATAASAITPAEGMIVMVSDTNGTFLSIGFWGYSNGSWSKFQ